MYDVYKSEITAESKAFKSSSAVPQGEKRGY